MSDFRVLVLDLDGTTLDRGGQLGARDIAAARALRAHGVHVTIATGRLFTGTQWVAQGLGITGSVAVMNGSELVDVETGVVVHGRYVERVARARVRAHLLDCGLATFLFGSRCIHYDHRDERHAEYLGLWTGALERHADVFAAPAWHADDDIVAVCASGARDVVSRVQAALRADLPPTLRVASYHTLDRDGFLEVRHADEDKGTALARLARERGVTAAECVAVGDWLNDLPMLRVAGRAFAMGHSTDAVKQAAGEVLTAGRGSGGAVAEVAARVWGVRV